MIDVTDFIQPDRNRHPDGVHRYRKDWQHPIIYIEGEPNEKTCYLCGQTINGWPYHRVTTFIGVLEDNFRLKKWGNRTIGIGLAMNDHLLLKFASEINPDDPHENKSAMDKILDDAYEAGKGHAGADAGTALHNLTERIDRGEKAAVPKANIPDIEAYQKRVAEQGLTWDEIEVTVVIDGIEPTKTTRGISGRFDRIGRMSQPCPTCGCTRRVADLKTQKDIDWGQSKTTMQLAAYALGKRYDPATGERTELDVCQCWAYVIHVPVGKGAAEIYGAPLEIGREDLGVALDVWRSRDRKDILRPAKPLQASGSPTTGGGSSSTAVASGAGELDIHGLIAIAGDRAAIDAIWSQASAQGLWAFGHTLAAKRRLAELEGTS